MQIAQANQSLGSCFPFQGTGIKSRDVQYLLEMKPPEAFSGDGRGRSSTLRCHFYPSMLKSRRVSSTLDLDTGAMQQTLLLTRRWQRLFVLTENATTCNPSCA